MDAKALEPKIGLKMEGVESFWLSFATKNNQQLYLYFNLEYRIAY